VPFSETLTTCARHTESSRATWACMRSERRSSASFWTLRTSNSPSARRRSDTWCVQFVRCFAVRVTSVAYELFWSPSVQRGGQAGQAAGFDPSAELRRRYERERGVFLPRARQLTRMGHQYYILASALVRLLPSHSRGRATLERQGIRQISTATKSFLVGPAGSPKVELPAFDALSGVHHGHGHHGRHDRHDRQSGCRHRGRRPATCWCAPA
jgi:hypothetical protein